MQTIVFHEKSYEIANMPNILADRFQINLKKGSSTMDEILKDVDGAELIKIYDDEQLIATYTNYKKFFAMTVIQNMNENVMDEDLVISIELTNTSMQEQINQLEAQLAQLRELQDAQGEQLDKNSETLDSVAATQAAALEDMGSEISTVADAQETQAQAIEDLGSSISELAASLEAADASDEATK